MYIDLTKEAERFSQLSCKPNGSDFASISISDSDQKLYGNRIAVKKLEPKRIYNGERMRANTTVTLYFVFAYT